MGLFESKTKPKALGLTLLQAEAVLAAARQKAEQLDVAENIAVVDAGNNLVAFSRMDGAWIGSIDIAMNKAFTARAFDMSTEELGKMSEPNKPLFGIHTTNHDKIVIFGGGIPLKVEGEIVGAIGASGGTVDQDIKIADAGVAALK